MKFESYNLHHCKKNGPKLVFWVFSEQLLYHITFELLYCYEVTLVKKYNKTLFSKSDIKIFDLKRFQKKLVSSQREKDWCLEIKSNDAYIANNKQMFAVKLIANLAVVTLF